MTGFSARASLAAAALSALALAGAAAGAPPKAEGRAGLLQGLIDCRKLTDAAARLACYDAAAGAMDQAEAKGDLVVIDREQARSVRRQGFGFNLPSLSLFERGETPEEVDRVVLTVDSARRDGSGKWILRMEGGQVWRQIDTGELGRDPRAGSTVRVRRATLGSYLLSVEGARGGIKVHRDN
jgi:hypothetical protein